MRSKMFLGWAIAAAVLIGTVFAADKDQKKANAQSRTVRGTVYTARDHSGIVAMNLLTADGKMYNIVLDQRGLELGDKMANRKVEVTGIVTENGRNIIRVQGWNPMLTAKVEAVKSAAGNITLVRLIGPEGTYDVVLDEKGIELGKNMDGKSVDVIGTMRKKPSAGANQQFVVKSYEEHKEPAEPKPALE